MTPPAPLLEAQRLCAWYGAAQILFDVDLEVRRGEVVALLGRNGAGKSTTLKALVGLVAKRRGAVRFMGHDLSRAEPHRAARLGLGFVPEDRRVFTDLTVLENLEVGRQPARRWPATLGADIGRSDGDGNGNGNADANANANANAKANANGNGNGNGNGDAARPNAAAKADAASARAPASTAGAELPPWTPKRLFKLFPNLGEMPHRPGGRMSGGEQQMLTVARTLMGNPFVVLLDEPSEGVAPVIVEQMALTILELKAQGVSILLSEQNMHFAQLVSDRAYVLEKGQIRYRGTMAELAADDAVRGAYLGL